MVDVVLVNPEIPPNTGNVIRLCANTGTPLHLVEPLGFSMDDRQLRRAGLDYHEMANVTGAPRLGGLRGADSGRGGCSRSRRGARCGSTKSRSGATTSWCSGRRPPGCRRRSSRNSPGKAASGCPWCRGNRSLNLSNAVAVAVYEAWRQAGYPGGA